MPRGHKRPCSPYLARVKLLVGNHCPFNMDDLIKSFKAQLYDRVTSPLLSSFLISWAIWNHRLFLVLGTSDLKLKERFDFVDNILYPTWWEVCGRGIAWPLLSALALLLLYPIPGRWVYEYVRKEQKRLKEIQQRIDDETPITREEAKELKVAIRKADADFQKEIDEREDLIARLRVEIAKQEQDVTQVPVGATTAENKPSEEPLPPEVVLDEEQINLLRKIAESVDGVNAQVAQLAGQDMVVGQYNLDVLLDHKFIMLLRGTGRLPGKYKATATGRAFLVGSDRKRA
jgi:hypothetical protein